MAHPRLNRSVLAIIGRRIRYIYLRILLVPHTPRKVAKGLAAGVLVGCLPIIPFQTPVSMITAWACRGSLIAAAAGTWVTNPLTVAPFYAAFFYIGRALTPFGHKAHLPNLMDFHQLIATGAEVAVATIIGGAIVGLICAPITYWLTLNYIGRLQAYERRKLRERFGLPTPNS